MGNVESAPRVANERGGKNYANHSILETAAQSISGASSLVCGSINDAFDERENVDGGRNSDPGADSDFQGSVLSKAEALCLSDQAGTGAQQVANHASNGDGLRDKTFLGPDDDSDDGVHEDNTGNKSMSALFARALVSEVSDNPKAREQSMTTYKERHSSRGRQSRGVERTISSQNSASDSMGGNSAVLADGRISNASTVSPYPGPDTDFRIGKHTVCIGISLSRRHPSLGHPETVTRQSVYDFNELQDREYKYVSSTDPTGWRAGGGEKGGTPTPSVTHSMSEDGEAHNNDAHNSEMNHVTSPNGKTQPQAPKIAAPDTVHIPLIYIDAQTSAAVDQIINALARGEIFIPHMSIMPESLSVNGISPPDLVVRFGCERNDDIPPEDWPNWCLEFMHNQLYEYFLPMGARWTKRPFQITLARKVRWKTVKHMNKYFAHSERVINAWRGMGPQQLDPQPSYIEGGATPEEVAKPHGIYLMRNGRPTNYFAPNFHPPYTSKMTRSLLLNVIGKSWDKKRRDWTSEPIPKLITPTMLLSTMCGCTDGGQAGFIAPEPTNQIVPLPSGHHRIGRVSSAPNVSDAREIGKHLQREYLSRSGRTQQLQSYGSMQSHASAQSHSPQFPQSQIQPYHDQPHHQHHLSPEPLKRTSSHGSGANARSLVRSKSPLPNAGPIVRSPSAGSNSNWSHAIRGTRQPDGTETLQAQAQSQPQSQLQHPHDNGGMSENIISQAHQHSQRSASPLHRSPSPLSYPETPTIANNVQQPGVTVHQKTGGIHPPSPEGVRHHRSISPRTNLITGAMKAGQSEYEKAGGVITPRNVAADDRGNHTKSTDFPFMPTDSPGDSSLALSDGEDNDGSSIAYISSESHSMGGSKEDFSFGIEKDGNTSKHPPKSPGSELLRRSDVPSSQTDRGQQASETPQKNFDGQTKGNSYEEDMALSNTQSEQMGSCGESQTTVPIMNGSTKLIEKERERKKERDKERENDRKRMDAVEAALQEQKTKVKEKKEKSKDKEKSKSKKKDKKEKKEKKKKKDKEKDRDKTIATIAMEEAGKEKADTLEEEDMSPQTQPQQSGGQLSVSTELPDVGQTKPFENAKDGITPMSPSGGGFSSKATSSIFKGVSYSPRNGKTGTTPTEGVQRTNSQLSLDYSLDSSMLAGGDSLMGGQFATDASVVTTKTTATENQSLLSYVTRSTMGGSELQGQQASSSNKLLQDDDADDISLSILQSTSSGGGEAVPTDEELFAVGWAKAKDPNSGSFYYFTLDRTKTVWENPLANTDQSVPSASYSSGSISPGNDAK